MTAETLELILDIDGCHKRVLKKLKIKYELRNKEKEKNSENIITCCDKGSGGYGRIYTALIENNWNQRYLPMQPQLSPIASKQLLLFPQEDLIPL